MQQLPDMNELIKIARSPAGQKLLAMLQSCGSQQLESIAAQASAGNMQEAGRKLSSLLDSPEARDLLNQLEKKT